MLVENRIASIVVSGECNFVESFLLIYPKLRKNNEREKVSNHQSSPTFEIWGRERDVVVYGGIRTSSSDMLL